MKDEEDFYPLPLAEEYKCDQVRFVGYADCKRNNIKIMALGGKGHPNVEWMQCHKITKIDSRRHIRKNKRK